MREMKLGEARLTAPFSDLRAELRPRSYLPGYFRPRKTVQAGRTKRDSAAHEFIVLINILTTYTEVALIARKATG